MNLYLFTFFFCFCFKFLLSLHRNKRDLQENLALNPLDVEARLEFASRNGNGIERLHSEPFVQQEGVYTALSSESMMVIILTTNLKLPSMSLIKKGTKVCALLSFFFFFFFLTF